jgi:hypothetical protein
MKNKNNDEDGDNRNAAHPLFRGGGNTFTTLVKPVTRPLSILERRWLATILQDPKMGLFMDDAEIKQVSDLLGEDAVPLFQEEDYCRFDIGHDSNNYYDADYRKVFRTILSATRDRRPLEIEYIGYSGNPKHKQVTPLKIEYSMKNDLFRLIYKETEEGRDAIVPIRIRRIYRASYPEDSARERARTDQDDSPLMKEMYLSVNNENNTLERAHIRFANYKVSVESVGRDKRVLQISYPDYEEEGLIETILSFGPSAQVVKPDNIVEKIRAMLSIQAEILK